jgi:hypothetical protein
MLRQASIMGRFQGSLRSRRLCGAFLQRGHVFQWELDARAFTRVMREHANLFDRLLTGWPGERFHNQPQNALYFLYDVRSS